MHRLARQRCRPQKGLSFNHDEIDYVLEGKIGDGAVGLVRKITQRSSGKVFAVKFLAPDPKHIDPIHFDDVATRFEREGRRGARLSHANLLSILGYSGNQTGCDFESRRVKNPYIIMEYVRGRTLESYIRRDRSGGSAFSVTRERLLIAIQIASALNYLRDFKLVHRDVKPANIFLLSRKGPKEYPLLKLGDFGIMKWGDFQSSLTSGTLTATAQKGLGTLKYMAPEQSIDPKQVTVRADIFSFGVTLFELFTGEILPGYHHVFEIMLARLARGTTVGRFQGMGISIAPGDERIGELLLDMFLRGAKGRPSIESVFGQLAWDYERRFGVDWEEDIF